MKGYVIDVSVYVYIGPTYISVSKLITSKRRWLHVCINKGMKIKKK